MTETETTVDVHVTRIVTRTEAEIEALWRGALEYARAQWMDHDQCEELRRSLQIDASICDPECSVCQAREETEEENNEI